MKEYKYTIDGKEYKVEIGEINAENVAEVTVNGEQYAVQMEQPAEPEKKKVELGKPAAAEASEELLLLLLSTVLLLLRLHCQELSHPLK